MRLVLLASGILLTMALRGQGSVIARVMDGADRTPLPYATVLVQGSTRGTITNSEGWFRLPLQGPTDSLRISFIGYRTLVVPFTAALDGSHIRLERAIHQLGEAVIRPPEDLYARVVAASTWLRKAPEVRTKLFFGLETHQDEQPVEILHGYYNATFKSAVLRKLELKQGHIGIAPKGDRHYINYNTAGAFVLMDIHGAGEHFPRTPLQHTSARGLRAEYIVELVATGTGPGAVDHLLITPRDSLVQAFRTELWLEPGRSKVHAVELSCTTCTPQPFIPLFPSGRIDSVDLRYRQTWGGRRPMPETTELEYSVRYTGPGFSERMHTHALMHAFEQGSSFIPTLFPWRKGLEEYPSIAWLPKDTAFWGRMNPPLATERQERDRAFILEHDIHRNSWYDSLRLHHDHLRQRYVAWSAERAVDSTYLFGMPPDKPASYEPPNVQLRTHLYLDMDTTGGTFTHRSIAVFDGSASWWNIRPWELAFDAYINIHFDLCEIERRAMQERLNAPGMTVERARRIHGEHTQRMKDQQRKLWMTAGIANANLMNWNMNGREALGVDRIHQLIWLRRESGPLPVPPFVLQGTESR